MLGQRINELRRACGWNQVELAARLNVTKQTMSNWENDNIQPSIEMLVRISKIFGVTTDYLLGLDDVTRLDVSGLPVEMVAHFSVLIDGFRKNNDK
ncbi:MAG: helix-turn-helix transcriptional regulator [Clostridia bacterium]|nr:helix-turn-helix transcriptional regulator [Clostridia bacterium]